MVLSPYIRASFNLLFFYFINLKKVAFYILIIFSFNFSQPKAQSLHIQGVLDLHGSGNSPLYSGTDGKAIHLRVDEYIDDLSEYSLDVISNGAGDLNNEEYVLSGSANSGDHILVYQTGDGENSPMFFQNYFGDCYTEFDVVINSGYNWPPFNGDDPVALFYNSILIDSLTFEGNPILSGPFIGDPYEDSWAYRLEDLTWQFGGKDCDVESVEEYSLLTSGCPYPFCQTQSPPVLYSVNFSVNTENIIVGSNGLYIGGMMFGGAQGLSLSDNDNDGYWTGDTVIAGSNFTNRNFVFINSPDDNEDYSNKEDLADLSCADSLNNNFRTLPFFYSDTAFQFCFGSCDTDGSCLEIEDPKLLIQGVLDLNGSGSSSVYSGNDGKAIHLLATSDITDLSTYSLDMISNGVGVLNNDEYILSGSVNAGDHILVYRTGDGENSPMFFQNYFGDCYAEFDVVINSGYNWPSFNGDDPVALFYNNNLIDSLTFEGNPILSGPFSGDPYEDSWAYRLSDGSWQFGGKDCDVESLEEYTILTSGCPYPICDSFSSVDIENYNNEALVIYPNPFKEQINILSNHSIKNIKIYDLMGNLVFKEQIYSRSFILKSSFLKSNFYLMELKTLKNHSIYRKIIKK